MLNVSSSTVGLKYKIICTENYVTGSKFWCLVKKWFLISLYENISCELSYELTMQFRCEGQGYVFKRNVSYRKNSKILDTSNNCHNCPKNRKVWCNIALMHPKDADGMANSVDPDQTASSEAVWSWSALFVETYLSQYTEFVRYFTNMHTTKAWTSLHINSLVKAFELLTSITSTYKLEWLSRDNLSSPPFAVMTYKHMKNWAQLFKASLA